MAAQVIVYTVLNGCGWKEGGKKSGTCEIKQHGAIILDNRESILVSVSSNRKIHIHSSMRLMYSAAAKADHWQLKAACVITAQNDFGW